LPELLAMPTRCLCRIAEVQCEYLLEPSGEIAIQRLPALIEAVSAARVEDQLLRLACASVKIARAVVRQHLIGSVVQGSVGWC